MNKFTCTFIFFITFFLVQSQKIQGTIYDENTVPLEGVSVYYDGTTLGTTTNQNGQFEINSLATPNAILVVSYIGYETIYLNSVQNNVNISLKPNAISLNEVLLEPIPFSRKEMLTVFRKQFLGQTKAGRNCVILNEDVIQFTYDSRSFKLSAFVEEPLKIQNEFLGYDVNFNLIDFSVIFSKRTLEEAFMRSNFFAGTSFFQEMPNQTDKITKNREKTYLGSSKHFFKNLIDKKWGKKEFSVFERGFVSDPNLHFEVIQEENLTLIKVLLKPVTQNASVTVNGIETIKFRKSLQLLFNNKEQSGIVFYTPTFYVDAYGSYSNIDQIIFSGEIAKKRMGDMLPADYE